MNKFTTTGLTALASTTVMTAGSELMSHIFRENYREPEHLETLIGRLAPVLPKRIKKFGGWAAHYGVGLAFAAVYVELWNRNKIKHNLKNALVLETISGLLGLVVWKGTFKAHPLPPWINYRHFYLQRIPAHIIFAVAATLTYKPVTATSDSVG